MSCTAQPAKPAKKPFAKKPTKWQWRLADGRLNKGVAHGRHGQVLSVMSLTAYMTARDIANALRIEPHVAQGALTHLLHKGAVERRIIPGSVHDTPVEEAKRIAKATPLIAGDIVKVPDIASAGVVVDSFGDGYFSVYVQATGLTTKLRLERLEYVSASPNPIAFNKKRYADCFEAPEPRFIVGTRVRRKCELYPFEYEIVDENAENNTVTMKLVNGGVNVGKEFRNCDHKWAKDYDVVVKAPAPPKIQNPYKPGDKIVGKINGQLYQVTTVSADQTMNLIVLGKALASRLWAVSHENYEAFVPPLTSTIPQPELLPMEVLSEVSRVFSVGANKYSRDDWASKDNGGGDHLAAAERHISKFRRGEKFENGHKGSGLHHIDHAIARLMMLRGKEMRNVSH